MQREYAITYSIVVSRRLTSQDTAEYLKQKGIPINVRTVKRYRARTRESAQYWIAKLAKSKRTDYIAEYKERIDEVRAYQRELWNICNDKGTFQRVKVEAISKLLDCTSRLVELYDAIPIVTAIRDYGCGYDHDNK